ncbi:MAG: hypothetical protein LC808_31395, partial [Actinobacteria bacterium]|nr:hypothetical protein [Actinomycetota bacterium]
MAGGFDRVLHAGLVWRPVGLAEPDHAAARGQRSTRPERTRVALPPGRRVVALGGGRWDATPCPPNPVPPALVAGHPGGLP